MQRITTLAAAAGLALAGVAQADGTKGQPPRLGHVVPDVLLAHRIDTFLDCVTRGTGARFPDRLWRHPLRAAPPRPDKGRILGFGWQRHLLRGDGWLGAEHRAPFGRHPMPPVPCGPVRF